MRPKNFAFGLDRSHCRPLGPRFSRSTSLEEWNRAVLGFGCPIQPLRRHPPRARPRHWTSPMTGRRVCVIPDGHRAADT